ncbi:hypothetical protein [Comamonas sp. C24C]
MNQAQQPEALRLAEFFESMKKSSHRWHDGVPVHEKAAAELRRLHARVQELEMALLQSQINFEHMESKARFRAEVIEELEAEKQRMIETYVPSAYVNRARITAADGPGKVVQKLDAAFYASLDPDNERDHSDEDAAIAAGKVQAAVQGRVG